LDQVEQQFDRKSIRDHEAFGAAVRTRCKQFERLVPGRAWGDGHGARAGGGREVKA
jgi:hypothetical protein